MNDKLSKELTVLINLCTVTHSGYYEGLGNVTSCYFDNQKFAKLIVSKVLDVQQELINNGHNAWHLSEPTKKYFGVDE